MHSHENEKSKPYEKPKISKRNKKSIKNVQSPYFAKHIGSCISEKGNGLNSNLLISPTQNPTESRLTYLFFHQPCITLAKNLLGKILLRKLPSDEILKGRIVETESYLGIIDKASHSYNGKKTERNEAMYLKAGTAYVYTIYGMYFCFNISSLEEGSAVLLRALEPIEGELTMKSYRSKGKSADKLKTKDLCNGPSKLCQAFSITKELNKTDLCTSDSLWLEEGIAINTSNIVCCKRIGIDSYGKEWGNKPLRFYIKDNYFVSRRNKEAEIADA